MNKKKEIAAMLLGIVVAIIIWITILSREKLIGTRIVYQPFHVFFSFWNRIKRGNLSKNFLGNILLFVPVGELLPMMSEKHKSFWIILTGFCFSLLIEITQFLTFYGCFDPDDVILNTLGTAIGYGLYRNIIHKRIVETKHF